MAASAADPSDGGFDVVFLDDTFGDNLLRGLDVTRELRARGAVSRSGGALPIIGLTGNAGHAGHNEAALAAGQNLVWGKPQPAAEQMRQQLDKLLGGSSRCKDSSV